MVDLLQVKWKSFVKREFFIQMILYTIFFCFASVAFIGRPLPPAGCTTAVNATLNLSLDAVTTTTILDDLATTTFKTFADELEGNSSDPMREETKVRLAVASAKVDWIASVLGTLKGAVQAEEEKEVRLTLTLKGSVADPDPVGSGPFCRIRIRPNFTDPDPTIRSHITRNKSNKLNRYVCEKFTFLKIKPANSEKGVGGRGGVAGEGVVGREVVVKAEKQ